MCLARYLEPFAAETAPRLQLYGPHINPRPRALRKDTMPLEENIKYQKHKISAGISFGWISGLLGELSLYCKFTS